MGPDHREQPARLGAINDRLIASGLELALHHFDAPLAERHHIARVHEGRHIDFIEAKVPGELEDHTWLDEDTLMCRQTLPAALRAAGAGILAVDLVMAGKVRAAFCAMRPPGHHAEHRQTGGFCIFNNIG